MTITRLVLRTIETISRINSLLNSMKYNHNCTKLKSTLTISFHWNASTTNLKLFHTEAVMQLKQQALAVDRTGNNPATGNMNNSITVSVLRFDYHSDTLPLILQFNRNENRFVYCYQSSKMSYKHNVYII